MNTLEVVEIPLDHLFVSENNIRRLQIEAQDLIPSIIQEGKIIKPLDVYRVGDRYAIIDGQRRFLAVKQIVVDYLDLRDKFDLLPCVVEDLRRHGYLRSSNEPTEEITE